MPTLPVGRGFDNIAHGQIPEKWNADWFYEFLSTWMFRGDLRNATTGPGITITGNSADIPDVSLDALKTPVSSVDLPITVTGSRASGAALVSLLAALVAAGIITDSTSA